MLESLLISLDLDEGHREEGLLPRFRTAMDRMQDSLTQMIAPDLPVVQLLTGARVLMAVRGEAAGRDAARLVGAYDALRATGHVPPRLIRDDRARTEAAARTLVGGTAYAQAYAEGGGLSLEEAAALI